VENRCPALTTTAHTLTHRHTHTDTDTDTDTHTHTHTHTHRFEFARVKGGWVGEGWARGGRWGSIGL